MIRGASSHKKELNIQIFPHLNSHIILGKKFRLGATQQTLLSVPSTIELKPLWYEPSTCTISLVVTMVSIRKWRRRNNNQSCHDSLIKPRARSLLNDFYCSIHVRSQYAGSWCSLSSMVLLPKMITTNIWFIFWTLRKRRERDSSNIVLTTIGNSISNHWKLLTTFLIISTYIVRHGNSITIYSNGTHEPKVALVKVVCCSWYRPNLLFGSLQNISAPVGLIEKLRPLYYIKRPIPLLMSHVLGLWENFWFNKVEREKNRWPGESVSFVYQNRQR